MNSFSSLNSLIIFSPEPQTTDFQFKINLKHTLRNHCLIPAVPIGREELSYCRETKIGNNDEYIDNLN